MKHLSDIHTTGRTLKIIAVVTMICDHVGATLIERYLTAQNVTPAYGIAEAAGQLGTGTNAVLAFINVLLRLPIGRIAFPIFVFLLVEGFIHTKNIWKYMLTVLGFAVVSEVPFDLAVSGKLIDNSYQNVLFTLFIGLVMLTVCKWLTTCEKLSRIPMWIRKIVVVIVFLLSGSLAEIIYCDYGASAICAIAAVYLCRNSKQLAGILSILVLAAFNQVEIYGLLAAIPLLTYNGERGAISRKGKYVFYAVYPVHLLILGLVGIAIGL